MNTANSALLVSPVYRAFLKRTHPHLRIDEAPLDAPSFIASLDVREPLLPGISKDLLEQIRRVAPNFVVPQTLFIGTPFERYNQTHLLDEIKNVSQFTLDAKRCAKSLGLPLVVLTNVSPFHRCLQEWLDEGFCPLPSFPDTVVQIKDTDFDSHLMRLPQANRSGIRRNMRKFSDAGYHLERLDSSSEHASELFEAYVPFFERARVRWQKHTLAYFAEVADLSEDVFLTAAKTKNNEIAGFVLNFRDQNGFQAGRIGVRPGFYKTYGIYFRLIYHLFEETLEQKGRHLSLEPTGYRMKRHLGADAVPMVNLVFGVDRRWQFLLKSGAGVGRKLLSHLEDLSKLEKEY